MLRGIAKKNLDQYEEAIEDYNEAIKIDPEYASAYHNRGVAKSEFGRHEEAIEDLNEALDLSPENVVTYYNRGKAKGLLGLYEEAIEDYNEVIDVNPKHVSSLLNNAEAHIILGEFDQAREAARKGKANSDSVSDRTKALLLEIITAIALEDSTGEQVDEYRNLCDETFTTTWSFEELDSWIEEADLDDNKRERIEELIELLREHKED